MEIVSLRGIFRWENDVDLALAKARVCNKKKKARAAMKPQFHKKKTLMGKPSESFWCFIDETLIKIDTIEKLYFDLRTIKNTQRKWHTKKEMIALCAWHSILQN